MIYGNYNYNTSNQCPETNPFAFEPKRTVLPAYSSKMPYHQAINTQGPGESKTAYFCRKDPYNTRQLENPDMTGSGVGDKFDSSKWLESFGC